MNHDYAHCLDYTPDCPKDCFRAELQRDIEEHRSEFVGVPLTYSHLGGTVECKLAKDTNVTCNMSFETDCISRQAAVDAMCELMHHWFGGDPKDEIREIRRELEKLPSAQRWIPVSERLPKEDGSYLVSGKWASGKESVGDCEFSVEDGYFQTAWNFDVLAWMPLPEPWKGEEE